MKELGLGCLLVIIIVGIVASIGGLITMLLWNWLIPQLFNGPEISFWMAWGLMILLGILFKGTFSNN